jgi:hypothetical protein
MLKNNKISDSSKVVHELETSNGSIISIVKKPAESIGRSMMAVPRWIVYAIGGVIILLGIILAAGIVYINQAPRSALYTEDCQGRSCKSGLNLKCISNKCTCLSNQYYSKGCQQKKTYNEKCNRLNECDEDKSLKCQNGFCQCSITKYWNENLVACNDRKTYGEVCKNDNCLSETQILSCIDGFCQCESTRFWTQKMCHLKRNQDQICYGNNECDDTQALLCRNGKCNCDSIWEYYDTNTRKCQRKLNESQACVETKQCLGHLQCSSGECSCGSFIYFEPFNFTCITQVSVNESCQKDIQCRMDLGLTCQSNKCQCNAGKQVWFNNTIGCVDYFNYSSVGCARNSHCQPGKSLICNLNPTSNQCNCPLTSIISMCDCNRVNGNEFYWNGSKCVSAKAEFSSCIFSHECLKPMTCNSTSKTCLCPFTQYYNSATYSCNPKSLNAASCSSNWTCREDLGLYCSSAACICSAATQFWHSTNSVCRNYYIYGEIGCSASSQCSPGLSLFCNANPSTNNCTCPILSQVSMCDCQRVNGNEFYWNGSRCTAALPFDSACSFDHECQTITRGLECNATTNRCYCMDGWNHYSASNKCYRILKNNGAASSRSNLFSKCPAIYSRSQIAIVSNLGIFNFLKSIDQDLNKANFKDSYVGGYFDHGSSCRKILGGCGCCCCSCSIWDRCDSSVWKWVSGSSMATSASSGSWCVGSKNGYYNENSNDICVRIDSTSATCFTNRACTNDRNFICEYPV